MFINAQASVFRNCPLFMEDVRFRGVPVSQLKRTLKRKPVFHAFLFLFSNINAGLSSSISQFRSSFFLWCPVRLLWFGLPGRPANLILREGSKWLRSNVLRQCYISFSSMFFFVSLHALFCLKISLLYVVCLYSQKDR